MKRIFALLFVLITCFPSLVLAKNDSSEEYGVGLLCPKIDSQVTFYTENNQQDAGGTIAFALSSGFAVTSGSVKSLKAAGAQVVESLCDGGAPGIRIDGKRDGWLQAGLLWMPPGQEWDYGDWQEYTRKAAIWKPLAPIALSAGNMDGPYKDKPYPAVDITAKMEIYPLKLTDDYALVLLDEANAFARTCAGDPVPPRGRLGWMRLSDDAGRAVAVPVHANGCPPAAR